jgi:hypothetical protein
MPCIVTVIQLRALLMQLKMSWSSESTSTTSIRYISSKITVANLCRKFPAFYETWDSLPSSQKPTVSGSVRGHINFVFFLMGDSLASEFYVPKTELTKCSDAGESPKINNRTFRTREKFEITLVLSAPSNFQFPKAIIFNFIPPKCTIQLE